MKALARYFHTLRHLRPIQIVGRARHSFHRPKVDARPAPPARRFAAPFAAPIPMAVSMLSADTFRFLGVDGRCAASDEWNMESRALLWTYNLHYFDDLNAVDADARGEWHRALIERWVAENPPPRGAGWDPYPVSRRIVNWIKWASSGAGLPEAVRHSLAVQMRWLGERIEYHLLGNHLFANAKALVFAGLYFDGAEAESYLTRGLRIVDEQLREQVLADGGHFERSPMYHAAALEDLLDLMNVMRAAGRESPGEWPGMAARMFRWLGVMSHPDGEISFFNDAAFGVAPPESAIAAYARRLDLPLSAPAFGPLELLPESGYARLSTPALTLLVDCAPVGPDYLPGHAHADTLSFELSVGAQRVFVNSGTSEYGTSPERARQRGTAAHNTVIVDGADSSEVWAGFRVARRARARVVRATAEPTLRVDGTHDGYRRLPGRNQHARSWQLGERTLRIEDHVTGPTLSREARLHLHPAVRAERTGPHALKLELPGEPPARLWFEGATDVDVRAGTWHPEFGASVPNRVVTARFASPMLTTLFAIG